MDEKTVYLLKKIGFSDCETENTFLLSNKYKSFTEYHDVKAKLISGKNTFEQTVDVLTTLSEKENIIIQEIYLLLLVDTLDVMYDKYKKAGIPENIIFDTLADIKIKTDECVRTKNIFGISRLRWFLFLYDARVFKLGRFQYALSDFICEAYEKDGVVLRKGMPVVTVHIPESNEKMNDEARDSSYKKAYEFFGDFRPEFFQNKYLPIVCDTWLFFEKHKDFLDENSSIVRFTNEFDIISKTESNAFSMWVFGREYEGNISGYPSQTSLQRAYIKWISDGNKAGSACGVRLLKY